MTRQYPKRSSNTSLNPCYVLLVFLLFSFVLLLSSASAALNLPLRVTEHVGLTRVSDPVTSGVPLPESANITSVNQLYVSDSAGAPVPAQLTVLSRWHGTPADTSKPIKWVLLDFQASVPANSSKVFYLREGKNGSSSSNLSVTEDSQKIVVSTGKAKFQISKTHFNLFDYVWIDKDGNGQFDDTVVASPEKGGAVLVGADGKVYRTAMEAPEEVIVEENGPMRTVVKVRGVFKADDGTYFAPSITDPAESPSGRFSQPYAHSYLYYNCRIHFYNNQDYVKVFFTLENNGANGSTNPEPNFAPAQGVVFRSMYLSLYPNTGSTADILTQDAPVQLKATDSFRLYQDWRESVSDFEGGLYYIAQKSGQEVSSGRENAGRIDVNGNSQGIGLAIRHFWQNFPKALSVSSSQLDIELWPLGGYFPHTDAAREAETYYLDGGRHKTYQMSLRFYSGAQNAQQAAYQSQSLDSPLMALAPGEWYAQTGALGPIAPAGVSTENPEIDEAIQRYDQHQRAMVYAEDSDNGMTINSVKTQSPTYWEFPRQDRFFGWTNFGDLIWESQHPASLHYDWTYSELLHYLRTGKRKLFDAGVEMAKHRYDYDQYHGERTDTKRNHLYLNHFQFYESDCHGDSGMGCSRPSKVSSPTHTWNGGLVLYYLLTGDRKAWEAAEDNARGVMNYYGKGGLRDASTPHCPNDEVRYESWSALMLINAYRVNGNAAYLETARNIVINRLLHREQQVAESEAGGSGHWGCDSSSGACASRRGDIPCLEAGCGACANTEWNTMYSYVIEPVIQTHYETHDEQIGQLLIRMADFSKDKFMTGGMYDKEGKYKPLGTSYLWVEETYDPQLQSGEIIKDIFFSDLFAYVYRLTDNPVYLDRAQRSFRDAIFYYAAPDGYIDPGYRSKISYIEGKYPNSHTKANGWLGRAGQIFLNMEWASVTGEGTPPPEIFPPQIVASTLPQGEVNQPYSFTFSVIGGAGPFAFTSSTPMPEGFQLSPQGTISGTPAAAGDYPFTITVEDSKSKTDTASFTLTIAADNETSQPGDDDTPTDPPPTDPGDGNDSDPTQPPPNSTPGTINTVTLRDEISDTTISGYSFKEERLNLGGLDTLKIWSDGVRRILLKSDLSKIPADAAIQKAELRLYCLDLRWPSDPRLQAYRMTRDWKEGSAGWHSAPDGATWIEWDYLDHDGSKANDWAMKGADFDVFTDYGLGTPGLVAEALMAPNGWVALDIAKLVQMWVSGEAENLGIMLQSPSRGYNDASFYSSEAADQSLRPELRIDYSISW